MRYELFASEFTSEIIKTSLIPLARLFYMLLHSRTCEVFQISEIATLSPAAKYKQVWKT